MWELSPDVLTRTPKLHIYSGIQILFSEFLKAAENVKKKKSTSSSIIIIYNPDSIRDLPQTLWRFVQQGIFIYTLPTSSAVDNSAFQWHSGGKSSVKTRAAPLQLSHHHKTGASDSRSQILTLWIQCSPGVTPKTFQFIYILCQFYLLIIVFCFNESSTLPEGKTPFII